MPELDGIEAARRIYAERPLPIVMLTAFSDRRNVEQADRRGRLQVSRQAVPGDGCRAGDSRRGSRDTQELLRGQRVAGETPTKAIFMSLPSQSGHAWNVRVARREDGSLDVRGAG